MRAEWTYRGGISTLQVQSPAERERERYEAAQRVKAKRAARLAGKCWRCLQRDAFPKLLICEDCANELVGGPK